MSEYTDLSFETECGQYEFDRFVDSHELGSLLQQTKWPLVKANWDSRRIVVRQNGEIKASAQILIRRIGLGFSLFYIPRGPVIDYKDRELCRFFFTQLKKWASKQRAAFIKIDPLVIDTRVTPDGNEEREINDDVIAMLKELGFIHHGRTMTFEETVQPRSQAVIDLACIRKPDKKLRYYLNNARKKGVKVMRMKEDGVPLFSMLEEKTSDRKNIALRSKDYFENLMKVYGDHANISIAYLDLEESLLSEQQRLEKLHVQLGNPQYKEAKKAEIGEQIASVEKSLEVLGQMKTKYGQRAYISGALIIRSDRFSELLYAGMDEELSIYRSNTSFQDAVDWAKENGCAYCNLGGVEGDFNDHLAGYKRLYQPNFESYIGEFDLPVFKPVYYAVSKMIPAVRKLHTVLARRKK